MAKQGIICSAPGSAMLLGEHAVLHGYPALVAALDTRLKVILTPLENQQLCIESSLGQWQSHLSDLAELPIAGHPLRFVFAGIQQVAAQADLPTGLMITIESEIDSTMGLGSSAALSVALVAVLRRWLYLDTAHEVILAEAVALIRQVQGRGSGADAAASCYGGLVRYDADSKQAQPLLLEAKKAIPTLRLIYTGYKTPTADVIAMVTKWAQAKPQAYADIYKSMGELVTSAEAAILQADWPSFAKVINAYQQQMVALGVCDQGTQKAINAAWQQVTAGNQLAAVKISGSGLGDCILGLAVPELVDWPHRQFSMHIGTQGLVWH